MNTERKILYRAQQDPVNPRRQKLLFAILYVTILLAGVYALFIWGHERFYRIHETKIEIQGRSKIKEVDVAIALFSEINSDRTFFFSDSLLAIDPETLKSFLEKRFPQLSQIFVKKTFPGILSIHAKERSFFALACEGVKKETADKNVLPADTNQEKPKKQEQKARSCFYIDEEGVGYLAAPEGSGMLLLKISTDTEVKTPGEQFVDKAILASIRDVGDAIPQITGIEIQEFIILSGVPSELRLLTKDGFQIFLKREKNYERIAHTLKKVLDEEIGNKKARLEYIDARFGNKVFYKFKTR